MNSIIENSNTTSQLKAWSLNQMYENIATLECLPNKIINLGIGLPTGLVDIVKNSQIFLQSENGLLGTGPSDQLKEDADIVNAGKEPVTIVKGGSFFDSAQSFDMIRNGKIDITILGGMEVSKFGDLANWNIPGSKIKGMGGAMDLVTGSKRIIVFMKHFTKQNTSKLVNNCTLPLTGYKVVNRLITEYGIFDFDHLGNVTLAYKPKDLEIDIIKSSVEFELKIDKVIDL